MTDLLSWWNLLFLFPLALSALVLLMNAIGLMGETSTDVDADIHADVHADIDTEGDLDSDHDLDHDVDHDVDHEATQELHAASPDSHHDADAGPQQTSGSAPRLFLEFLGAGRIPVTLIFQIFFFSWGIAGWILNKLLQPVLIQPWIFIWISLAGALLSAAFVTRFAGTLIWKYAPLSETYAKEREELIGCEGEAIYNITGESGMAQVYDDTGTLHRIYCRIQPQEGTINQGEKILIVGYNSQEDLYLVNRSPLSEPTDQAETIKH